MQNCLRWFFKTKWKREQLFIIEYCLHRIYMISNYEHGLNEEDKIKRAEEYMTTAMYNLGWLDYFHSELSKLKAIEHMEKCYIEAS